MVNVVATTPNTSVTPALELLRGAAADFSRGAITLGTACQRCANANFAELSSGQLASPAVAVLRGFCEQLSQEERSGKVAIDSNWLWSNEAGLRQAFAQLAA